MKTSRSSSSGKRMIDLRFRKWEKMSFCGWILLLNVMAGGLNMCGGDDGETPLNLTDRDLGWMSTVGKSCLTVP